MASQKEAFMQAEGDAWFDRNPKIPAAHDRMTVEAIRALHLKPTSILEIGCASGSLVSLLRDEFEGEAHGIDPSAKAIAFASERHPGVMFSVGTADELSFADGQFDLVLLSFCMCLVDPHHHFKVFYEIDRVLRERGTLVNKDFLPPMAYRNEWAHKPGIAVRKMEWARMLTCHPSYTLLSRTYGGHGGALVFSPDERMAIDILYKDRSLAFPSRPPEFSPGS